MKILKQNDKLNIVLNNETDFKLDLGREENLQQFEEETLRDLINPIESFETIRFKHKSYIGATEECDIWFYFYFYNNWDNPTHVGGLDYTLANISEADNSKMLKDVTQSFFRLEFYKVPDGEEPERINRKLAFAKNLSLPLGEKVFSQKIGDYIFVPIFIGTNYRNKENMYFYWFQTEESLVQTVLTGDTFYMTARFFNTDTQQHTILNFGNKSKSVDSVVDENTDLYYKIVIDRSNYTYQVFTHDGVETRRIGKSGDPICFFEIQGGV